jgi:hypothetical protein
MKETKFEWEKKFYHSKIPEYYGYLIELNRKIKKQLWGKKHHILTFSQE